MKFAYKQENEILFAQIHICQRNRKGNVRRTYLKRVLYEKKISMEEIFKIKILKTPFKLTCSIIRFVG